MEKKNSKKFTKGEIDIIGKAINHLMAHQIASGDDTAEERRLLIKLVNK